MNAGTSPLVTINPLTAPAIVPANKDPRIAKYQGHSNVTTRAAPTTEDRPSTDPKERSSPAELMTKVAPIANTPKVAVARMMLKRLFTERNTGESIAIAAESTTKTISDSRRMCNRDSKTNSLEGFFGYGPNGPY